MLLALAAYATACTHAPATRAHIACEPGDRTMVRDALYFGRNRLGGGSVSDAEWTTFLAEAVTPRFPDGFTVHAAQGQWRGANGAIERESSNVLVLLHDGNAAALQRISAIADEYRTRFRQEAVLRERSPACVAS